MKTESFRKYYLELLKYKEVLLMSNKNKAPESMSTNMTDMEAACEIGHLRAKVSELEQALAGEKNHRQQSSQDQALSDFNDFIYTPI
jgi:hypothetical protein